MTTPTQDKTNLNPQKEEIDLRDFIEAIWQGKITIVTTILLFGLAALLYVTTAQQWWVSRATITAPTVSDMAKLTQGVSQYHSVFDAELESLTSQDKLLERYLTTFNANDNKREFFEESKAFSRILELAGVSKTDGKKYRVFLQEWLGRISANKKSAYFIVLSTESNSDESSLEILNEYINFTNKKVNQNLRIDLESGLKIRQIELLKKLEEREAIAAQKLEIEIANAELALMITDEAKILRPVENLNSWEIIRIDLGADALRAKVKVLKSMKDLTIVDSYISELTTKLEVFERQYPKDLFFSSFAYIEKADVPISSHKPKRMFIVGLSILLGFSIGLVIVLVRSCMRKYRKTNSL
ncbi:Wzz/FepE/Etk N-terminal domain-containing protein [Enterovibrio sp. 27052020O]|uniref:Wzz/FepE/Etk N-terminal domain-containing protein n=1 Tax=Enterovibrio sp. 27052020O TaxID=3241166 RepID=UPI00388ED1EF